jgi:hypothetical protein
MLVPGRRVAALGLLAGLVLASAGVCRSDEIPDDSGDSRHDAEQSVRYLEDRTRLTAAQDFLAREIERLTRETERVEAMAAGGRGEPLGALCRAFPDQSAEGLALLGKLVQAWDASLAQEVQKQEERLGQLRDALITARAGRIDRQRRLAATNALRSTLAAQGPDWAQLGPWVILAPLALLVVARFDLRQPIRRWLHRIGCLRSTLLLIGALVLLGAGALVWRASMPPPARIPAVAAADHDADAPLPGEVKRLKLSRMDLDRDYGEVVEQWKAVSAPPVESGSPLLDDWVSARRKLGKLHEVVAVQQAFSSALRADLGTLNQAEAKLASSAETLRHLAGRRTTIRLAGGIVIPAVCLGGVWALYHRNSRRRRIDGDMCVRCHWSGKLVEIKDRPREPGDPEGTGGVRRIRCEAQFKPGEPCDFEFPARVREWPRLCIPTLGITRAGKTHWMAAFFDESRRSDGSRVRFEPIRTQGLSVLEQAQNLLRAGVEFPPTQPALPDPVIYEFGDADALLSSEALLNLFDFAGEVAQSMDVRHPLRRRMLDADGYFAFLDPMKSAEEQFKLFEKVHHDLRETGRVTLRRVAGVPAAICVPKLDRLRRQAETGATGHAAAIKEFFEGLRKLERARKGSVITASLIDARSRLTARLIRQLWPREDLEDRIQRIFGRRYRFFPMTPLGLDHVGDSDGGPAARAEPYAVREPLLWILHANGYVVFRGVANWIPLGFDRPQTKT